MISANWMTLGFANAKRNVKAPARDPSENSARAARNFAEPFSCEAPSGSGAGGRGCGRPLRHCGAGGGEGQERWPGRPRTCPARAHPLSRGLLGPSYRRVDSSRCPHPILFTPFFPPDISHRSSLAPGRSPHAAGETHLALPQPPTPASTHTRASSRGATELARLSGLPYATPLPPPSSFSLSFRPSPASPREMFCSSLHPPKPSPRVGVPQPAPPRAAEPLSELGRREPPLINGWSSHY